MNIITFQTQLDLYFSKPTGQTLFRAQPFREYVFARSQLSTNNLKTQAFQEAIYKQSLLDHRVRAFNAYAGNNCGSVLVYNGCGGFGDQLMTWPLVKILADMGYKVSVLADPGNADCWAMMPWVHSILPMPTELSTLMEFDHHAMFEVLTNMDEHAGQLHPLDVMLNKISIDPRDVADTEKCVAPTFTATEIAHANALAGEQPYAVYQLTSAARTRSFSPDESVSLLKRLAFDFPELTWLATYDGAGHSAAFNELLKEHPINIIPLKAPSVRVLMAIIAGAVVGLGPDSFGMHAAGVSGVPYIGFWGPTAPHLRAKYYENHIPLFEAQACPHAPCNSYLSMFPKFCPSLNTPQCQVLSAISFDEVSRHVRTIYEHSKSEKQ
jgi:ADP-heptose:LPS heptosyltransferase